MGIFADRLVHGQWRFELQYPQSRLKSKHPVGGRVVVMFELPVETDQLGTDTTVRMRPLVEFGRHH